MKTFKKTLSIALSIIMSAMLFGCSSQEDTVCIDIDALSGELLEKAEFEDELSPIDDTMIKKLYNIEDYVKAKVYISSGATAEEIAVFEFDGTQAAKAGLDNAEIRIQERRIDFESYIPKEVKKLDNAIANRFGKYVIVCVSNGNKAEKIITQYISEQNEE